MTGFLMPVLAALGAVLLAIASGAGGSALLELYYKPKRERRKAARLLAAEININAEMILLQSEIRKKTPRKIPRDCRLLTHAWQSASGSVAELPPGLLKRVQLLYARFEQANENVLLYADAVAELDILPAQSAKGDRLKAYINSIIDVFNTGLDESFELAKKVLPELIDLAQIPKELRGEPDDDYEARVQTLLAGRAERLKSLAAMDEKHTSL